jgi:hypothetical protein
VVATDSCVVALETSWGLEGAVEWHVPGRGGSGGGVPSPEAIELSDALREYLLIMFSVGFAKSCDSMRAPFLDRKDALLLSCVGVVGELYLSEVGF